LTILILTSCHSDPIGTSGDPQPTIVGGTITSDTTWRAENGPYHVIEDLNIPDSVNWTVEPGTDIIVDWNKSIQSRGMAVLGDYGDSITVSSSNGVWRGFEFRHQSHFQTLYQVVISNAVIGAICSESAYVIFTQCRFLTCDSIGVFVGTQAGVIVDYCEFVNDHTLNLFRPTAIRSNNCSWISVYGNHIRDYYCGVRIQSIRTPDIFYNTFENCDIGIICENPDSTEIFNNQFRNCQTGILIIQGSPSITYNTFEKMDKCIEVKGSCQPEAHYNSFIDANRWVWVNNSPYDVDATYNWWGTTDPDSIDQLIYDHNDDPDYGTVHYEPFLTTAPQ
jgi:hypothetical protein